MGQTYHCFFRIPFKVPSDFSYSVPIMPYIPKNTCVNLMGQCMVPLIVWLGSSGWTTLSAKPATMPARSFR